MSEEPPKNPAPILGYATRDADGLPDWVAEAEALIDAGAPPKSLGKLFRKRQHAAKYFAKSMSRRFDISQLSDQCVQCGSQAAPYTAQVLWGVQMPAKNFQISFSNDGDVRFFTFHTVCPVCLLQWAKRFGAFGRIRALLGLIGIFGFIAWLALEIFVHTQRAPARGKFWPIGITFVAVLFASTWISSFVDFIWRRRFPKYLRSLMPRGVKCLGMGEVGEKTNG